MTQTTEQYWDCECKTNYIHPKIEHECRLCRVHSDEQPDSIVSEVLKFGWYISGLPTPDDIIDAAEVSAWIEDFASDKPHQLVGEFDTYLSTEAKYAAAMLLIASCEAV